MKRPVVMAIQGRQSYQGQEPEMIRLDTEGTIEFRDGAWELSYEESELTGLTGVTTTFRIQPGIVTLRRTGALNNTMVFQEGVEHDSLYQMDIGTLLMTVKATRVWYDLVEDGGSIDLVYEINIENSEAGVIDYHLDIRPQI